MSELSAATAGPQLLPPAGMEARRARSNEAFEAASANTGLGRAAPFISPVTRVDAATGVAVQMYRDGDTGEVELQYPSEATVKAYSAPTAAAGAFVAVETKSHVAMPQATAVDHQMLVA